MHKVYITGVGFATSIGTHCDEVQSSLRELRHGFRLRRFPGNVVEPESADASAPGIELVCGEVEGFETHRLVLRVCRVTI